ncbi:pleiotropic drug resistance protein 1-like, partial [Trifolium medium]|nr:pleiotropic drug resistance protein 1-like [Trifolium medium]
MVGLPGVSGLNRTTQEADYCLYSLVGLDFTEYYKNSNLYRRNKQLIQELGQPA